MTDGYLVREGEHIASLRVVAWPERIVCPSCECAQTAWVEWRGGRPWPGYVHECLFCGYLSIESEWEEVKDAD